MEAGGNLCNIIGKRLPFTDPIIACTSAKLCQEKHETNKSNVWARSSRLEILAINSTLYATDRLHFFLGYLILKFITIITITTIIIIIIISLLMSPLLGHRPCLWITHKENGPKPTTRAQCGLVGENSEVIQHI
jgi:hypothetical protein